MNVFKYLSVVFAGLLLFAACEKEYSIESGYAGKAATGALIKDSMGNCSSVGVKGVYIVDSTVSDINYVTVQVDFATGGTYRVFSDTQNGFSFQDSGFTPAGRQTIKLKATGKPAVAKRTTFQVAFDTTFCSFTVDVIAKSPAVYTFVSSGNTCSNPQIDGTYTVGQPLTSANQVTLEVLVTVPGGYFITTGSVGGMTFTGTGNLNQLGLQIITLQASGVPATAGNNQVPISNGTSGCSFTVPVIPGTPGGGNANPNLSDTAWRFTQGTKSFNGFFYDVHDTTLSNQYRVQFFGFTAATRDSLLLFEIAFPTSTIQPGIYNTKTAAQFGFIDYRDTAKPAPIYTAIPANQQAANTQITITSYDATTRMIAGTFAGTAMNAAGSSVPITNGRFKGKVR